MNELLDKIRSRGYWKVAITPVSYPDMETEKERVSDLCALQHIMERRAVRLRPGAWGLPHLRYTELETGADWIGHELDWHHCIEWWRFYQTGRFVHYRAISDDWRDQSGIRPPDDGWRSGASLDVKDAVAQFTEAFELAARLVFTDASDGLMRVEVTVSGIEGRTLTGLPETGNFAERHPARIPEYYYGVEPTLIQTVIMGEEAARNASAGLFECFGWETDDKYMWRLQADVSVVGKHAPR